MRMNGITCTETDEGDLEARYAAGTLAGDEAEAFEAHFFACDRCWTLVQRAIEVRAVESAAAQSGAAQPDAMVAGAAPRLKAHRIPGPRTVRPPWWIGLAAAMLIVAVGTWRVDAWRGTDRESVTMRGPMDSLHVVTGTRGMTLVANWSRAAGAGSYRVRLYSAGGVVLHEREVADTSIALAASALPKIAPGAALYWEIQAISRMHKVVARSGLHIVRYPAPRR